MKTSELTGQTLACAVGMCLEEEMHMHREVLQTRWTENGWKPHEDWAQGGPIVEQEGINLIQQHDTRWLAFRSSFSNYGPTPLIAAMRCYVASKLGDDVEIPEELA